MECELKRVSPLRAAKIGALVYGLTMTVLGLVIVPFAMMGTGLAPAGAPKTGISTAILMMVPYALGGVLLGGILGFLIPAFYNLVTRWTGGLLFEFYDSDPGSSSGPA